MIDKNGKLFGKINVIDLLIIVIIIAALAILGVRALGGDSAPGGGSARKVRITFVGTDIYDFLPDALSVGDPVAQYTTEINLGTLASFSSEPAYDYVYDNETGEAAKIPVLNRCFLTFTTEAYGEIGEWGLTIEDTVFIVGGNYWINIGPTRAYYQLVRYEAAG